MPPDGHTLIRQLLATNNKLAEAVIKTSNRIYKTKYLPIPLVRLLVEKSLYMVRHDELDPQSGIFHEKMSEFAKSVKPRFRSQLIHMQSRYE